MEKDFRKADGGMKSRKLLFAVFIALAIVASSRAVPDGLYDGCVAGLVSVCAIYVGGNTASRWVHGRSPQQGPDPKPAAKKPAPPTPIQQGE